MDNEVIEKATKTAYYDSMIDGLITERIQLSIAKDKKTAYWYYDNHHHIFIGDQIFSGKKTKYKTCEHYAQSFFFHEVGHALYTERNIDAIQDVLARQKISFQLFNLFEDARIEHLIREKLKRPFGWSQHEGIEHFSDIEKENQSAGTAMFFIIQNDGRVNKDEHKLIKKCLYFYNETIKCKSSWGVIEVIEKFLEQFPEERKQSSQSFDNLFLSEGQKKGLEENSQIVIDLDEIKEKTPDNNIKKTPRGHQNTVNLDNNLIKEMSDKIKILFKDKVVYGASCRPGKKLNIRGIIRDSNKTYKRKILLGKIKKKINIVIDLSGSMDGEPLMHASTILAIFSNLAKENMIIGKVLFSNTSVSEVCQLPIENQKIEEMMIAYGGENFQDNFNNHLRMLSDSDINLVITDGHIVNGDIDTIQMRTQGIKTWGLYVGKESYATLDCFDKSTAKKTLKELIEEMITISFNKI